MSKPPPDNVAPAGSNEVLETLVKAHIHSGKSGALVVADRTFDSPQRLRGLELPFALRLERVTFLSGFDVRDCTFSRDVSLDHVNFGGASAAFEECTFAQIAAFRPQNARLFSLRGSTFVVGFELSIPRDQATQIDLRLLRIQGSAALKPLDYGQAEYAGVVDTGPIEVYGTIVGKESSLELAGFKSNKLHLGEIVLQDKCSVFLSDVQARSLYFNDVRQVDKANVAFDRVSLDGARFTGTNVERFTFTNVRWPLVDGRAGLMEEAEWRSGRRFDTEATEDDLADAAERVIENYRQLVLNYESKRNYELAERFHTSEMEMLRHRVGAAWPAQLGEARFHLNAYALYKALSGYGADYVRAAWVLVALLVAFSAGFMFAGISERGGSTFDYDWVSSSDHRAPTLPEVLKDSARGLALTLSIVTLQKDRPFDPVGLPGTMLSSILLLLIPAQAALLLFALRRRFRRASI